MDSTSIPQLASRGEVAFMCFLAGFRVAVCFFCGFKGSMSEACAIGWRFGASSCTDIERSQHLTLGCLSFSFRFLLLTSAYSWRRRHTFRFPQVVRPPAGCVAVRQLGVI